MPAKKQGSSPNQPLATPQPPRSSRPDTSPTRYLEQRSESFQLDVVEERMGPVPDATEMARFNSIDPEIPKRLIAMAEKEQENRHNMVAMAQENRHKEEMAKIDCERIEVKGDNFARNVGSLSIPVIGGMAYVSSVFLALNGQATVAAL